jgi:hypothetical protein
VANEEEEEHEAANVFNPDEIVCDPALRKQINEYRPDVQDQVKMAYLLKGPTKPIVNFPKTGSASRGFYFKANDKVACHHG